MGDKKGRREKRRVREREREREGVCVAAGSTHSLVVEEVSLQCLAGHVLLPVLPLLVLATVVVPSV